MREILSLNVSKFKYSFEYVDADLFLLDKRELRYSQRILNIKRISEL